MTNSAACIAFTARGCALAVRIASALRDAGMDVSVSGPARFCTGNGVEPYESVDAWTKAHFHAGGALIFVGAAGIAVRAIAPYVTDKFTDPAVVQIDEKGQFAISLLSGHVGGANKLARQIARVCDGQAVVSTATDVNGVFAVDEWAREQGYEICERELAKEVSAQLLEDGRVGFTSDFEIAGELPDGMQSPDDALLEPELGIHVTFDEDSRPFKKTLHLVPRRVIVGVGCRRGIAPAHLEEQIDRLLAEQRISSRAVRTIASVDVKREEPAILEYAQNRGHDLRFFSAEELQSQAGAFSHSEFVEKTVGVDNVCERAAVRASEGGKLICAKQARDGVTLALAVAGTGMGLLSVVGLGPGGRNDMTLRARKCLERAELIAGYTVYVDLVAADFPNTETLVTPMRKEVERCRLALEMAAKGKRVALVCSGDPGVYGMAGLVYELADDYKNVEIEVIPGVSAANGGASVLGAALMHDYALISLSDLLTPWQKIERRLQKAAQGDFVICLYNPSSRKRADYLKRACDILLESRSPKTVCGYVRNIGREGEESHITTLGELRDTQVDMFTTVFIGNSQTRVIGSRMVTPRGYEIRESDPSAELPLGARVLIFGGTSEGRELAAWLSARKSCEVLVSSVTDYGGSLVEGLPRVRSHVGKLPKEQIRRLLEEHDFTCVIDATHPYAGSISTSVRSVCEELGVPLERVVREDEQRGSWVTCADARAAAQYVNSRSGKVLLTTGSKELHVFTGEISRYAERLYARILPVGESLERAKQFGIPAEHIIAMRGPFSTQLNCALLREYNIDILVTKASGSAGGFEEKLEAARECGVELVVISRPCKEDGLKLDEIKERLEARYGV